MQVIHFGKFFSSLPINKPNDNVEQLWIAVVATHESSLSWELYAP